MNSISKQRRGVIIEDEHFIRSFELQLLALTAARDESRVEIKKPSHVHSRRLLLIKA